MEVLMGVLMDKSTDGQSSMQTVKLPEGKPGGVQMF